MADETRLREVLNDIVQMIDNCADVPRNPDSLPMMVMEHARRALEDSVAPTWRHLKRGTLYTEVGRGELQMARDLVDGSELIAYRGEDGRLWFREVGEFEDGRFERVPAEGAE